MTETSTGEAFSPGSNAHTRRRRRVSIIIPAHNQESNLRRCLENIRRSALNDYEVIVADDGSTDATRQVAVNWGATVVGSDQQRGPADARNRGARLACGEILVFLDADVCVHDDTVARLVGTLDEDATVDAVFGSYDTRPHASNLVSQFRNLLHHYVHQKALREATTFWAGCGAIRRSVFIACGGFDAGFPAPTIEDIELGVRLRQRGHRIVVNKAAQATHLKRWTLRTMIGTDLFRRGIPWARLILRTKTVPNDLNVRTSQRLCVAFVFLFLAAFLIASWEMPLLLYLSLPGLLLLTAEDLLPLTPRSATMARWLAAAPLYLAATLFSISLTVCTLVGVPALLGAVLVNARFYAFLSRERDVLFAALAIPLHMIYFAVCGTAFVMAGAAHLAERSAVLAARGTRWRRTGRNQPFEPVPETKARTPLADEGCCHGPCTTHAATQNNDADSQSESMNSPSA